MKQILPLSQIDRNKGQIEGLPPNPRIIRDAKFEKLVQSIIDDPELLEHRGLLVFAHEGRFVSIGGNMRLEACRKAGKKEVTCETIDPATPVEKLRAYMIKDNASFGEWDWDAMSAGFDIEELANWGIDIPNIDLGIPDETEAEEDNFEIPEEIEEVRTDLKTGDVIEFKKGNLTHRLLCGDSTKTEDLKILMDGRLADLVITDPPYNVAYTGGTKEALTIMNDSMSDANFRKFLADAFTRMNDSMKRGAAFYIYHADSEGFNFRAAAKDTGWKIRQCLVWVKNQIVMGRQDYQWKHEPILYGWKDGAAHFFVDDRTNSTVIEDKIDIRKMTKPEMIKLLEEIYSDKTSTSVIHEDKPQRNAEHPTMKPIRLLARQVKNSSKVGQLILDSFLGSGSTMVAAHQLSRNCYGLEMDNRYCQVIIDRMMALDPEIDLFINGEKSD